MYAFLACRYRDRSLLQFDAMEKELSNFIQVCNYVVAHILAKEFLTVPDAIYITQEIIGNI